jgi:sRNA-binding regulator protein Hfq
MPSNKLPPQSKSPSSSGISSTDVQRLNQRIEALEKLVRDSLDEKNHWNSQVREWIGKPVKIQLVSGESVVGLLRWVDRYTLCLDLDKWEGIGIVHKGAIAIIRQINVHVSVNE